MSGMRVTAWVGGAAVAAAGVALWVRYLARRQHLWRGLLAEAIPVHSSFWREQAARAPREDELLYVALGDSAAQGIGASRPSHSYVGFIARGVREATGRPVRVVNLAISGARVREALERELPRLRGIAAGEKAPDLVTVCIGANDIAEFDEERFSREIRELLGAVAELHPDAVVGDLPSFYFLPGETKVRVANRILRAAAAELGLTVVPLHDRTERQGLWGVTTQFAGDLFHPNDRGYRIWADAFLPEVLRRARAADAATTLRRD